MIETIAQIFGMTFLGIILICLIWTIISYIMITNNRNNKLQENLKKFESIKKEYEPMNNGSKYYK
jgi:hypothetical protein|tara:strand:- start:39 stop:233 length:195 start_codon:yes stop_codon:yes gene_type:complete